MDRKIYQPIHPDIRHRLDPEYLDFHEKYLQYTPPSDSIPWDPASRFAPAPSSAGKSSPIEVGSIRDLDKGHYQLRVFMPKGAAPEKGWPVFVWYHGGGWVMGGLASENSFLSVICSDNLCVVVSVNYRHAPEHPYPAAINDSFEGFTWIVSVGAKELGIDSSKLVVGGLSAGGGLAAIVSLKAGLTLPSIQILKQVLIVPVIDNTATASTIWASNKNAPWLTPSRMMWYRRMYMPNESDWCNWDASPNLAPIDVLVKSPKTWIAVSELDILCEEGKAFGEQLKKFGVVAETVEYKGSTHSILILDGYISSVLEASRRLANNNSALKLGKQLARDASAAVAQAYVS